jgi:outer membrane lipoprotein-sorting protein
MKSILLSCLLVAGLFLSGQAFAHTPLCSCYDNGDETITCEGGFSDGSSAAGVELRVLDKDGKAIVKAKMNEDSEFTFKKPSDSYKVVFDAGPGHVVIVDGKDIVE